MSHSDTKLIFRWCRAEVFFIENVCQIHGLVSARTRGHHALCSSVWGNISNFGTVGVLARHDKTTLFSNLLVVVHWCGKAFACIEHLSSDPDPERKKNSFIILITFMSFQTCMTFLLQSTKGDILKNVLGSTFVNSLKVSEDKCCVRHNWLSLNGRNSFLGDLSLSRRLLKSGVLQ